ncbi:hypothetical protein ATI14_1294 [Pseudomonas tolaasii NCPPB 2192]|uniref:Uncharacterized protein n=1 Tax=Pseudomonas tolaasii NCPPB 2192 TaxID=564423 RepID=A0ABX4QCE7_PSETO|nr:3-hydroxydecyl-ACP dehydratase [Pseudomonas tolaasii]KAB0477192.1 3-hydroxydecyl-ACP dehydratase [Pseudomonas tolaasii]PKA74484.1 hypothetical protein ATI14_1294 [Pseudomonas tolaasii NCPPB 2192]
MVMLMPAEFILSFEDTNRYAAHLDQIKQKITRLETFSERFQDRKFRLACIEPRSPSDWSYYVRLFLEQERISLKISAHPISVEQNLSVLFEWIRSCTRISLLRSQVKAKNQHEK